MIHQNEDANANITTIDAKTTYSGTQERVMRISNNLLITGIVLCVIAVMVLLLFMTSAMSEVRGMFPAAWQSAIIDSNVTSGTLFFQDKGREDLWISRLDQRVVTPTIVIVPNFTESVHKDYCFEIFAFERGYRVNFCVEISDIIYVSFQLQEGPYDDELEESGYWPMNGTFIIELLNQNTDSNHYKIVYLLSEHFVVNA